MIPIRLFFWVILVTLASCGPSHFYLVRHAEKMDQSQDPPLSPAGQRRAEQLAEKMSSAKIDLLYATDFQRTRQTLQPLADNLNKEIIIYDARDPWLFVRHLKKINRVNLVVAGHSNTIPEMVLLLTGDTVFIEHEEYDRLFLIKKSRGFFKDNYRLTDMTYGN